MTPRLQAEANGDKFYNGKPCCNCQLSLRYTTTGHCVECLKTKPRSPKVYRYVKKRKQTYWFANCEHCGKEFRTFPSKLARGWGKCCSKPCSIAERIHKAVPKVRQRATAVG